MKIELLVLLILITNVLTVFQYPSVRRDDTIVDNYFGRQVKDPYRWLENPDSVETRKFIEEENNVTRQYLQQNIYRDQISNNFKDLLNYPKYGVPIKSGSKYYYSANTGLLNHAIYYSIDTIDSDNPQVFLDPNQWSRDGTTSLSLLSFSKDGKYCAYGLSEGGSDWITIKIKDTETLEDLPEILTKVKFTSTAWTPDNIGFFYAQYDEFNGTAKGTNPEIPENQKLFYHKLNTDQSEDIKIVDFPDHPKWLIGSPVVSEDGQYVHIFPRGGTSIRPWFFAKLDLPVRSQLKFIAVSDLAEDKYNYVTSDDNFVYMRTNRKANKYRLIRVDLNQPQEAYWINIIPEDTTSVMNDVMAINKHYLAIVYMKDVVNVIKIHNLTDGSYLWTVDTPIGTVQSITGERNDTEFFYKISTLLLPGIVFRYDFSKKPNIISTFKQSNISGFDAQQFETRQVFFRSKDGTVMVPMFLVHKRDIKLDGSNPTLLYGYGGFNINVKPSYSILGTFFANNLNGIQSFTNIMNPYWRKK